MSFSRLCVTYGEGVVCCSLRDLAPPFAQAEGLAQTLTPFFCKPQEGNLVGGGPSFSHECGICRKYCLLLVEQLLYSEDAVADQVRGHIGLIIFLLDDGTMPHRQRAYLLNRQPMYNNSTSLTEGMETATQEIARLLLCTEPNSHLLATALVYIQWASRMIGRIICSFPNMSMSSCSKHLGWTPPRGGWVN